MGKILIRGGISPLDTVSYPQAASGIAGNLGNLMYFTSIIRGVMVDDAAQVVPLGRRKRGGYRYEFTDREIDELREDCDCFIIPLADAFRPDFMVELRGLTELVKKLNVPTYVIGCGLRTSYEPDLSPKSFDGDVRDFISAVLERSTQVGVRGWITAEYLGRLGFQDERDYTIIGCPSMYMYGNELNLRLDGIDAIRSKDAGIAYNMHMMDVKEHLEFIQANAAKYENAVFIPQQNTEFWLMYAGVPLIKRTKYYYPTTISDSEYVSGKVRFFGDAVSWIDFMRGMDFSFGNRLHGNVAALVGGCPALFMPFDGRERELVEYHRFTNVTIDMLRKNADLEYWVHELDFGSPNEVHGANFEHYVDFLDKNGIKHIYRNDNQESIFDKGIKAKKTLPVLKPITVETPEEIARRLQEYHHYMWETEQPELPEGVVRRYPMA